jgi:hypothetical protein
MENEIPNEQDTRLPNDDFRTTHLYELLKNLKPKQKEKLLLIMKLDFIIKKKEVLGLLEKVIEHIGKQNKKPLYKEDLIASVTDGYINAINFNQIISDLSKKIRQVLYAIGLLKGYEKEYNYMMLGFFESNGMNLNSKATFKRIEKILSKKNSRGHTFHYQKMQYHEINVISNQDIRRYNTSLRLMNENLDGFYAENKLRFLCEEMNRIRIIKHPIGIFFDSEFETYFIEMISNNNFFGSISVEVYFKIYKMLKIRSIAAYEDVYQIIENTSIVFSPNVEASFIQYLMNQCIYFINKGVSKEYYANDYVTYIARLDNLGQLFHSNGRFPLGVFQNRVSVGLILKEKEITRKFIKETVQYLNTSNKKFMKCLHLALLEFEFGNVLASENYIEKIQIDDSSHSEYVYFNIFYYKIYIQILYAQKAEESAFYKAEALRKYVERQHREHKTISTTKKAGVNKFVSFFKRIITTPKRSKKWDTLKQSFYKNKEKILYFNWLDLLIKAKK